MRVAFFSFRQYEAPFYPSANGEFSFFSNSLTFDTRQIAYGYPVISCFVNDHLDEKVLVSLAGEGLKMIALRCAGFNNVDLDACKRLGIQVSRVPAYSPYAVAEHAVALMLCLNRRIFKAYNRVRESNFSLEGLTGFDLHNAVVGVVGTGKIGQAFCRIMLGFGSKVLAYDPYPDEKLKIAGVQYLPLNEVLEKGRIISLHLPLTDSTHHMINEQTLARMTDGVFIINTSRGGLVDTQAVIKGLKSGKIGALGLDVYEEESGIFFIDHSEDLIRDDNLARLMTFPNVLITSHQAFLTAEALSNIARTTMINIQAYEQGNSLPDAL